eukprot:1079125-Prymnesium_polylepis.1
MEEAVMAADRMWVGLGETCCCREGPKIRHLQPHHGRAVLFRGPAPAHAAGAEVSPSDAGRSRRRRADRGAPRELVVRPLRRRGRRPTRRHDPARGRRVQHQLDSDAGCGGADARGHGQRDRARRQRHAVARLQGDARRAGDHVDTQPRASTVDRDVWRGARARSRTNQHRHSPLRACAHRTRCAPAPQAIFASGAPGREVNISSCTFEDNVAAAAGGAVYGYAAAMSLRACAFVRNRVSEASATGLAATGGAVINQGGAVSCVGCSFVNNSAPYGGAVDTFGGATALAQSSFEGNAASVGGGALLVNSGGALSLAACCFRGSSAGGGAGECAAIEPFLFAAGWSVAIEGRDGSTAYCTDAQASNGT